jgi:DNA-binding response OmpR family regulator
MSVQPPTAPPGILVADDDGSIRFMLGLALLEAGFAPLLVADGREAVELFQWHKGVIQAALLDVHMPRLDGPGALVQLRQIAPQVRCCFMTGCAEHYGADNLLALGAARVFDKPFRLNEVIRTLGELCDRPR